MARIGAYDAKTHLPRLIERVRRGERITITRRGVPVAELVPVGDTQARTSAQAVAALRRFRRGRRLDGLKLREVIETGRR